MINFDITKNKIYPIKESMVAINIDKYIDFTPWDSIIGLKNTWDKYEK